jgi:hypothetical protein
MREQIEKKKILKTHITTLLISFEKFWRDKYNNIKKITNYNPSRHIYYKKQVSRLLFFWVINMIFGL